MIGNIRFDVASACIWLDRMFDEFPELREDYELRRDTVEGETNVFRLIDQLIELEQQTGALRTGINVVKSKLFARDVRLQHRQEVIRQCMMKLLEAADLRKAERPSATVSIAAGRSKIVITDENELPEQFIRIKREPNKEEIAKALKDGITVPGATLSNSAPTLQIRT